jgi:hypothetical protein
LQHRARLAFLERKRKAELKRMSTKDVPIQADEEDIEAYLYVPISIAPGTEANNISQKDLCSAKIQKFQGGSLELYCRWMMDMQELFTARDCDDILDLEHVEQQLKLYKTTLTGPAMDAFTTALKHKNEVNQARQDRQEEKLSQAMVMVRALNELGLRIFGKGKAALRRQRRYRLTNLPTIEVPVQEYCDRLLQMSMCLQFFPVETINIRELNPSSFPKTFDDSKLMEALEHAAPDEWKAELKKQHITNFNSLNNMKWHYKDIQDAGKDLAKSSRNGRGNTSREDDESQLPRNRQSHSQNCKCKGKEPSNKKSRRNIGERNKRKEVCEHCRKGHDSKDCWELPENQDKHPDWWRPPEKRGYHNDNQGMRNKKEKMEQSHKIELSKEAFARLVRDAKKGRKKNSMEADNSKDDTDSIRNTVKYYENMRKSHSNNSNGSESPYSLFPFYVPAKNDGPPKGQKYTAEIIVEVRDKNRAMVPIRALLTRAPAQHLY